MKWVVKDIEVFQQEKEYVDTVVVPLVPIALNNQVKSTVSNGEYIDLLSSELERQFKGRIILLPSLTYLKTDKLQTIRDRMNEWTEMCDQSGVKHVVFITSDNDIRSIEDGISGKLMWFPSIPLEHVEEEYKHNIIREQIQQIMSLFIELWQENS